MEREILCLKSLTQALILNLVLRSLWQLSVARTPPHTEQWQTFCWRGQLLNAVSYWKLFGFNPVAASPWSCRLFEYTSKLSTTMMAFSAHSLNITFRSLLSTRTPHLDLFYCSQGDQHLGIGPFPVCVWGCLHSNCNVLWARRVQAHECVSSGWAHWPRPNQLMKWTSASLVSDLCRIHYPWGGVLITITIYLYSLGADAFMPHATFFCCFSVFARSSSWTLTP